MEKCHCPKCNQFKDASKFSTYIDSRGRNRKQCEACKERKSASGFATKATLARQAAQRNEVAVFAAFE